MSLAAPTTPIGQSLAPERHGVAHDGSSSSVEREPRKKLKRPSAVTNRIVWRYTVPIVTLHLLSLAVFIPWLFSWTGVVLLVVGIYFYGGLGINIAYHRLLTHRSFKCPLWLERFFVVVAICCMEDAPGSWVATHRLHHNDADDTPDPHSPLVNFFWSHVGWLLVENLEVRSFSAYERFARDVLRDPFYMRLQRTHADHLDLCWRTRRVYYLAGLIAGWAMEGSLLGRRAIWSEPAGVGRDRADRLRLAHQLVGQFAGAPLRLSQL